MAKRKYRVTQYMENCPALQVKLPNGRVVFLTEPNKVTKVDDNTVIAYYDGFTETITASGTGDTRSGFTRSISPN